MPKIFMYPISEVVRLLLLKLFCCREKNRKGKKD